MKQFLLSSFALITFFTALIYFVSCLTPYISPVTFWPMAFLALGFPYLACCIVFFILVWFFIRRKVALFLLLLFFVGFENLFASLALNFKPDKELAAKDSNSIRILTWNVRGFDNPSTYIDSPTGIRRQIFNYIRDSHADILCFQEFNEHLASGVLSNTTELVDLGYSYYYKTNETLTPFSNGKILSGTAFFSKVPIIDTGKTMLGDQSKPEHIAYIDLIFNNKRMRVFSTHLKSLNLFADTAYSPNPAVFHFDTNFIRKSTRFEKLKVFAQDHAREVLIAKREIKKSPYPIVFTADMNSVPTSYPYHIMSLGLQDAFIRRGWGLGGTMDSLPNTLRIDIMLIDKKFQIQNFHKEEVHLSDHYPQIVDLQWKQ